MKPSSKYRAGVLALFSAAACWGSGHAVVTAGTAVFSPQWLVCLRLGLAALLLAILGFPKWKQVTAPVLRRGVLMGCLMYGIYFCFALGVRHTATSRASFIIGAYILFIPAAELIVRRRLPGVRDVAGTLLCFAGLALILFERDLTGLNGGDLLVGLGALSYAFHVVVSAGSVKQSDPLLLNMVQLGTSGLVALAAALCTGPFPAGLRAADFTGVVYLAVAATVVPYSLSLFGQKQVRTATGAVILSFESVFGCIGAILMLGERLSVKFVAGAAVVICSFFVTEGVLFKKKARFPS